MAEASHRAIREAVAGYKAGKSKVKKQNNRKNKKPHKKNKAKTQNTRKNKKRTKKNRKNRKGKKGKKVAAAPLAVRKQEVKRVVNPLFEKRARNVGIGQDIQPQRDLSRYEQDVNKYS